MLSEKANASQATSRLVEPNELRPTYHFLRPGLNSDSSLRGKFNDNCKSDYCFWCKICGRSSALVVSFRGIGTPIAECSEFLLGANSLLCPRNLARISLDHGLVGIPCACPTAGALCSSLIEKNDMARSISATNISRNPTPMIAVAAPIK